MGRRCRAHGAARPVPQHPISTCSSEREEFSTAQVLRVSQGAWPSSRGLRARGKLLGQGKTVLGASPNLCMLSFLQSSHHPAKEAIRSVYPRASQGTQNLSNLDATTQQVSG